MAGLFGNNRKEEVARDRGPQLETPPTRVRRPVDHPMVRRAQETVDGCEQQVARLTSQLADARERVQAVEAKALEAEARGDDVAAALEGARQRAATLEQLVTMAERGRDRAVSARNRALDEVRRELGAERVREIVELLDKQEELLWRVLETQQGIDEAAHAAFRDGIPIGLHERFYWTGFPGFPFVRQAGDILTWLRHRSISPRAESLLGRSTRGV